ncbi:MAG: FHA domain-containing protein [Eubacteriales bacterium]
MAKISCEKGHYYDPEKHTLCPYCGIQIDDFEINYKETGQKKDPDYGATMPKNGFNPKEVGKTMPKENINDDAFKTVAMGMTDSKENELVVGWLVCLDGENKGKDYKILIGRNRIGRDHTNEIIIDSDMAISRDEHSCVIYDPVGNNYYLVQGRGRGLCYVNEKLLISELLLKPYDKIKIGNTELMFIPLCSEQFKW